MKIRTSWITQAEQLRVLLTDQYYDETHLLNFINSDGIEVPLFSKGNISVISGKPKSKKSFLCTLLVSHMLSECLESERLVTNYDALQGSILYFDTEQSGADCQKIIQRLQHLGVNETRFILYKLRELGTKERLLFIEETLQNTEDIDVVIVDGVRDLVRSINSEEEATDVSNLFMKWTEIYNIHLITVLHQNKSDENLRGHIGSELQNKAESVFEVRKGISPDQSSVFMSYSRRLEVDPFGIQITADGIPFLTGEAITHQNRVTKEQFISSLSIEELSQIASEAFQNNIYPYTESISILKAHMNKKGKSLGDNAIKSLYKRIKEQGALIIKHKDGLIGEIPFDF